MAQETAPPSQHAFPRPDAPVVHFEMDAAPSRCGCKDAACQAEKNALIRTIRRISDKDAVSRAIERFEVAVRHGLGKGVLPMQDLLTIYQEIRPSLHRLANDPKTVDLDALGYAIVRLPATITGVRRMFITPRASDVEDYTGLKRVRELSRARRRPAYQVPGEELEMTMVAPAGTSEILDLASLLCCLHVEGQKFRAMLADPARAALMQRITAACQGDCTPDEGEKDAIFLHLSFLFGTTFRKLRWLDGKWDGQLLRHLYELATAEEPITLYFHPSISSADYTHLAAVWFERLVAAMRQQRLLDSGRPIHVISSNTHSFLNVLSSYPRAHKAAIVDWAATVPEYRELAARFDAEPSLPYTLQRAYLEAHPELAASKREFDRDMGITILDDPLGTGLECQLIDVSRLDLARVDPRLVPHLDLARIRREQPILINFDYAFGEQGERIMGAVSKLGKSIASVSIMGKAGTVVGERGGIMVPTYFVKQGTDDVYDLPNDLREADFLPFTSGSIDTGGPMLTVLGTILQNNDVLEYYRIKWQILGLEMEAIPYVKKLKQALLMGVFGDVQIHIAYYASDAPLNVGQSLAEELGNAGVEPVYSITLAVLSKVL